MLSLGKEYQSKRQHEICVSHGQENIMTELMTITSESLVPVSLKQSQLWGYIKRHYDAAFHWPTCSWRGTGSVWALVGLQSELSSRIWLERSSPLQCRCRQITGWLCVAFLFIWVGLAQLKPVHKYRSWSQSVNTRHGLQCILKKMTYLTTNYRPHSDSAEVKSWL